VLGLSVEYIQGRTDKGVKRPVTLRF